MSFKNINTTQESVLEIEVQYDEILAQANQDGTLNATQLDKLKIIVEDLLSVPGWEAFVSQKEIRIVCKAIVLMKKYQKW